MDRHCYCKGEQISCGKCYKWGKDGHTRHSPMAPSTLRYCDKHYAEEAILAEESYIDNDNDNRKNKEVEPSTLRYCDKHYAEEAMSAEESYIDNDNDNRKNKEVAQ